jgi:hypothetical protein
MYIYWHLIMEPLLEIVQPRTIIEIGAERGDTTRPLLDFCQRHDATLHSIDPHPLFDWQNEPRLVMHRALSLQALPTIGACDACLIDGDHNYYTVFNELMLIGRNQPFPLTFVHDIGWPYGRRDSYYDPRNIPAEHRHQCVKMGLLPGLSALVPKGGFNANLWNARAENTPKNGVLTAVEDFMKATSLELELVTLPAFYGLGILFPKQLLQNQPFAEFIESLHVSPVMLRYMELAELLRLKQAARQAGEES